MSIRTTPMEATTMRTIRALAATLAVVLVETAADVPDGPMGSNLELKLQCGDEVLDVVMERGAPVWGLWHMAE